MMLEGSVSWLSYSGAGSEFHTVGPATAKLCGS